MSNAAKYKKKAAELELQKQFDKAVAMYVRAIEAGDAEGAEVDVTVLNKVGDLTLRLGRVGEAVTSYERAVEHYTTVGLFNNAIALCNKILRHAPGRAGVYLTLGRVCARKGMRGDATRNFLEYASRMKQEGRTDEAMRSLAEVAGLMPELEEVRRLVEEHAERVGIALPAAAVPEEGSPELAAGRDRLVFLDIDYDAPVAPTPPLGTAPIAARSAAPPSPPTVPLEAPRTSSLDDLLIFDPLSDDALVEAPAALEGLEAPPEQVRPSDVPSLLTPTEPMDADPSLPVADGLTDALGFDVVETEHVDAAVPLDGLVSGENEVAVPLPLVPDGAAEADEVAGLDMVVAPDDVEGPLAEVAIDATEEVAANAETIDDAEGSALEASSDAMDDVAAPPEVEFLTLTPYQGVATITPPSSDAEPEPELDTLSPYDGVETVPTPSSADEPVVELHTLTPYGGVDAITPPSIEAVPPNAAVETDEWTAHEILDGDASPEVRDAVDTVDAADMVDAVDTVDAVDMVDAADMVDAVDMADAVDMVDAVDAVDAVAEGAEAPAQVGQWPEVMDELDGASAPVEPPAPLELALEAMDELDEPPAPIELSLEVMDELGGANAPIEPPAPLELALEATDELDEPPAPIELALEVLDELDQPPAPLELAHEVLDELDEPPAPIELAHEVMDELDEPPAPIELAHEVMDELDARSDSTNADEDGPDDPFDDLMMGAPLPPAHSARPARVIPRLDPHDFILPGELPPIVLPDRWLGIEAAAPASSSGSVHTVEGPHEDAFVDEAPASTMDESAASSAAAAENDVDVEGSAARAEPSVASPPEASLDERSTDERVAGEEDASPEDAFGAVDDLDELDAAFTPTVSAATFNLALERCERLRSEVEAHPGDWARRRRLAEALLEAGERADGLDELAATALGLELEGALPDAVRVLDDLVRVAPEQVAYHQKRVELAVRLGDRDRLRESYLDLADALVRSGHAVRAEPVYVRVLELDPWDDRARAALGDAAPPPPSPKPSAAPADDGYVNLADWLADDAAPRDTRIRVKEPTVTGDEDADFDQLLQNFREGVARSLGEDDYESHYDLGVAYKEMGLLDDAVAEFQRALRSPTHRLPAYEALGQCFLEQGSFPVAVTVLSRALHEPGLDDEQRVGVLYLLGYACEALQRRDDARSYYQRVYATDIHFRDVAERLAALAGGAQ